MKKLIKWCVIGAIGIVAMPLFFHFTMNSIYKDIEEDSQKLEERETSAEFRGNGSDLQNDLKKNLTDVVYSDTVHGSNTAKLEVEIDNTVEPYQLLNLSDEYVYIVKEYTYYDLETTKINDTQRKRKNGKTRITRSSRTHTYFSLESDETVYFKADNISFGEYELDVTNISTIDMYTIYSTETGNYDDHSLKRTTYYGIKDGQSLTMLTDIKDNELVNTEFYRNDYLPESLLEMVTEQELKNQQEDAKLLSSDILAYSNTEYFTVGNLSYSGSMTLADLKNDGWQLSYEAGIETKEGFDASLADYHSESNGKHKSFVNLYNENLRMSAHIVYENESMLDNAKIIGLTLYTSNFTNDINFVTPQGYDKNTTIALLEQTYEKKGGIKKEESYGLYYEFDAPNLKTSFSCDDNNGKVNYVSFTFK